MGYRTHASVAAILVVLLTSFFCQAADHEAAPAKEMVLDGHVVHNLSAIQNHVTNWGLIGSRPGVPTSFADSPSGYWQGWHHIWTAGIWVGGVVLGEQLVTTGGGPLEMRPTDAPGDTIFPAFTGIAGGARYPWENADDDGDGAEDEDPINGLDDDGDGAVDEDFAAIGDQYFRCVMADTAAAIVDALADHNPLNLEIVQQSFQWADPLLADAIGYDFTIRNVGVQTVENVHCGMFSDFDINGAEDDQAGSWRGNAETAGGHLVPVTVAYMRDGAFVPRAGWMGWVMCGVVTDAAAGGPADPLAVQSFQRMHGNAAFAQGGDPTNDSERYQLLSAGPDYWDADSIHANDYRVLLSSEAVPALAPGESVTFRVALVVGVDLESMVAMAAEAVVTAMGASFDRDGDPGNGDEFRVPWLRPQEIPVPAVSGNLRARTANGGVALAFDLRYTDDMDVAVVRRAGRDVPARRWNDVGALVAGGLHDDDAVGWPRTYDLVLHTARGSDLVLDTVIVPGPAEAGLALAAAPNPFNPRLTIHYVLPHQASARLDIHDLSGKLVRTIFAEVRPMGPGQAVWDGRDRGGQEMASGVYLVRLVADGVATSQRVTLMR